MILNNWLNEIAKAAAGESFVIPAYGVADTALVTPLVTDTVLPGEKGSRYILSVDRTDNAVTFSGIRSGTQVLTSSGDNITAFALLSASSGGTLLSEVTVGTLNQSTSFDIETITTITFNRAD